MRVIGWSVVCLCHVNLKLHVGLEERVKLAHLSLVVLPLLQARYSVLLEYLHKALPVHPVLKHGLLVRESLIENLTGLAGESLDAWNSCHFISAAQLVEVVLR